MAFLQGMISFRTLNRRSADCRRQIHGSQEKPPTEDRHIQGRSENIKDKTAKGKGKNGKVEILKTIETIRGEP